MSNRHNAGIFLPPLPLQLGIPTFYTPYVYVTNLNFKPYFSPPLSRPDGGYSAYSTSTLLRYSYYRRKGYSRYGHYQTLVGACRARTWVCCKSGSPHRSVGLQKLLVAISSNACTACFCQCIQSVHMKLKRCSLGLQHCYATAVSYAAGPGEQTCMCFGCTPVKGPNAAFVFV